MFIVLQRTTGYIPPVWIREKVWEKLPSGNKILRV